jgi:superfamily II RNA helicase
MQRKRSKSPGAQHAFGTLPPDPQGTTGAAPPSADVPTFAPAPAPAPAVDSGRLTRGGDLAARLAAAPRPQRAAPPPDQPGYFHGLKLSAFQLQAIEAIQAGHNVLVSAPTGAGKTLVAEYAIEDAVRRGKRCIYTAPIKALSNQKFRDFRDSPLVEVGLMTGDVTIHPRAQVLIMTTEILRNAIFENPDQLADIEYVVFDEVHYMDDLERGSVWEESLVFAPKGIRFICLSATISNLDQLGAWIREIREQDLAVVRSTKRPVPLKHRLYTQESGIFDLTRLEHVRAHELERALRKEQHSKGKRHRGDRMAMLRERREQELDASSALLDQLQAQDLLPALVFSFSRKDCERLASKNQRRNLLDAAEREKITALQEDLVRIFQLDPGEMQGDVFRLARQGLGYHHAGMLPIHKEVVERMFTSGLLKLLFTTETFALGINMPARTAVFHMLKKFDGVSFDYLRTREYMQMAGRAGRQGIDKEGLVVSILGPRDLEQAPIERILSGKVEPVDSRFRLSYSSILHLLSRLGRERLHEAWEKSFDHYQHRGKSAKARDHNVREQRRVIDAHLSFLEQLGYIEKPQTLTTKGKIARNLYGYEMQITEMLFAGTLENLPIDALAVVFVALIYEERRRGEPSHVPSRLHGNVRKNVSDLCRDLLRAEAEYQIEPPLKLPDWGLTAATVQWMQGGEFAELEKTTDVPLGDLCRTFRMALQLMRQVRRVIDPKWDLSARLEEAASMMNRDVVDAKRQLELG